ncbi:MAG TPA: hypothetical protein VM261_00925 [Kofleriaceae bacterium]|nr:hypothetical protein [Kofleriaceae bacterium]
MPSIEIYATRDDTLEVLAAVESTMALAYVPMGQFSQPDVKLFTSAISIPDVGVAEYGISVQEKTYLLIRQGHQPQFRVIQRSDGRLAYSLDQAMNSHSATLRPGGGYKNAVIAGQVATVSSSEQGKALYSIVARHMRNAFSRYGAYWVGKGALECARSGARLTPSIGASRIYDLVIDART